MSETKFVLAQRDPDLSAFGSVMAISYKMMLAAAPSPVTVEEIVEVLEKADSLAHTTVCGLGTGIFDLNDPEELQSILTKLFQEALPVAKEARSLLAKLKGDK